MVTPKVFTLVQIGISNECVGELVPYFDINTLDIHKDYLSPTGYQVINVWVDWLGETVIETVFDSASNARIEYTSEYTPTLFYTYVATHKGAITSLNDYLTVQEAKDGHVALVRAHGGNPEGFYPRPDWYIKSVANIVRF